MARDVTYSEVVIANDGTQSTAIDGGNKTLVGIRMPTMTSTAISIQESDRTDGTFRTITGLKDLTFTAGETKEIEPSKSVCGKCYRVVSGSAEGAERKLELIFVEVRG